MSELLSFFIELAFDAFELFAIIHEPKKKEIVTPKPKIRLFKDDLAN